MILETEAAKELRRRSREAQERGAELRESKEAEINEELKAAAAMERADHLVREVKHGRKQMQNIIIHMQQVTQAIRQLRTQLQLAQDSGDSSSIKRDKERLEEIKEKIKEYQTELVSMRGDLIREQMEELKNGVGVGLSTQELQSRAEQMVDKMIASIKS